MIQIIASDTEELLKKYELVERINNLFPSLHFFLYLILHLNINSASTGKTKIKSPLRIPFKIFH